MKNTDIIVSNPCDKDWNKMTTNNNGRFCGACKKTVIDFTTWDKAQIHEYLKNKNERVCGHFLSLQVAVKRPSHHQFLVDLYLKTERNRKLRYAKPLLLPVLLLFMTLVGCNRPNKMVNERPRGETGRTTGLIVPHFRRDFRHSVDDTVESTYKNHKDRKTGEVEMPSGEPGRTTGVIAPHGTRDYRHCVKDTVESTFKNYQDQTTGEVDMPRRKKDDSKDKQPISKRKIQK
ncbi:MAG: hypothetical protein EB023_09170 [Flavobacteriia bacterium]|nr:hypothetical protein [Flavobacteriia bacterium]